MFARVITPRMRCATVSTGGLIIFSQLHDKTSMFHATPTLRSSHSQMWPIRIVSHACVRVAPCRSVVFLDSPCF